MAERDSAGSRGELKVGERDVRDSSAVGGAGSGLPAVQPQGAAGEPAAHRGRGQHHRRAHPRARGVGSGGHPEPGDPVHPGARDHAGLHRRAVHRRPRRHARGDARPRRRSVEDQPAGAGRARHRPQRHRRLLRRRRFLQPQRRARVRAQPGALPVPALGPGGVRQLQGRPAGHRHRPPGQHRAPGPRGLRRRRRQSPTPTRSSAPTATPRWSTASACSAGASAASRPRRPCSASRSACSSRRSSASS